MIDLTDLQTPEGSPIDATRVTLRDITSCLRAVGAVALGVAALSRELREWRRDLASRRARRDSRKSGEGFRPDHA